MKTGKIDAIGFTALVCVVGLAYFGLIHGQTHRLSALRESSAKLTRVVLSNDGLEKVLDEERADVKPLRDKLDKYTGTFVGRNEIEGFLRQFAADADTLGVSVSLLRPGEIAKDGQYGYAPIDVHLEGAFAGVYALLHSLEYGRSFALIGALTVQCEPGKDVCQATLTINVFLKPDEGA